MPKIKLDITIFEIIVDKPVFAKVNHEFSDIPIGNINVLSYSYIEVFAEKIRALKERTRPRDLYDVISFYRRPESLNLASTVKRILKEKCNFKAIEFPTIADMNDHKDLCEQGWTEQLEHQVPILPSFNSFWEELPDFLSWLNGENIKNILVPISFAEGESNISLKSIDLSEFHLNALNLVRFAAANHLCVEMSYVDQKALENNVIIEPYSLRSSDGKILLYGQENINTQELRAINVHQITKVKILKSGFKPAYKIEFLPDIISLANNCDSIDSDVNNL
jgi:hypothetical protein